MRTLFLKFCEYVFPERIEHRIVRNLNLDDLLFYLCPTIKDNTVSLLPFSEPIVRAVVHEAKFQHNEKAWELLGEVLAQYLKHNEKDILLLPIPLSAKRQRKRKYNQVEEITRCANRLLPHLKVSTHTLFRKRDTVPQTTLKRKERLTNVKDAFGIRDGNSITNRNIIVLDDVSTTGATLSADRQVMEKHHPAKVTLLSLAR